MLKVCIIMDVEGLISLRQGNPRWNSWEKFKGKLNNLIKNFRYEKKGYEKIYNLVVKEKFPVSFMLVGSLFKPKEKFDFIDYGYHTLNHLPLTLIDDKKLGREVKNINKAISFSPPLWMIEDIKNPSRVFKTLKKEDYKIVIYKGKDDGIKCYHHDNIRPLFEKYGLFLVHKSNDFTGSSSRKKMLSIFKDIEKNKDKKAVYCITTHDFVHKNLNNFVWLIRVLKEMQNKRMIKIVNMAQLNRYAK
jgi:hypothetical protein